MTALCTSQERDSTVMERTGRQLLNETMILEFTSSSGRRKESSEVNMQSEQRAVPRWRPLAQAAA